ncbi:MAG: hypothetical protein GY909_15205 [Oligoflexia bacterium]|nr:hypothetical protein [Oligoflexia bacterium]
MRYLKKTIALIFLSSLSLSSMSYEISLTNEQKQKLEELKRTQNKNRTYVPNFKKRSHSNPNIVINREDSRVVDVHLAPNDTVDLPICFGSPVRIFMADKREKFSHFGISENQIFFSASIDEQKRSAIVMVTKPVAKNTRWPGYVSVYRESDGLAYNFYLDAIHCPTSAKEMGLPIEIRVHPLRKSKKLKQSLIHPQHFITDITKARARRNIHEVSILHYFTTSNYEKISLPISIKVNPNRDRKKYNFEFIFIDSLQIQKLKSKTEHITHSSVKSTRLNGSLTLEFNAEIEVTKKYIKERGHIYMLIVDEDRNVYSHYKIPLTQSFKQLEKLGIDLD